MKKKLFIVLGALVVIGAVGDLRSLSEPALTRPEK